MKKISVLSLLVFAVLTVWVGDSPAVAAPLAKVAAFPNGEGLEEFLSGMDSSRITKIKRVNDFDDTAILIVPLSEGCYIEVYEAELNENFEVIPKRGQPGNVVAESPPGHGLLFWSRVPEGIPAVVAVLNVKEGERSWSEHWWSPAFSGVDGSLVTNDEFITFESEQILTMEQARNLLYENYVDAELFHPGELDKWKGDILLYCFVYNDGDRYRYAYVNSKTGEVEIVDEIEGYTDEDQ